MHGGNSGDTVRRQGQHKSHGACHRVTHAELLKSEMTRPVNPLKIVTRRFILPT